jgi:type II secretory pathway pseudopilin PulG
MIEAAKKINFKKEPLKRPGFTLVEIVVVLFIISLGLIGVLTLIIQNIQSQSYNKNNLIAYQLAQEGIELVRKVRDSNWKAHVPYNTNLVDGEYYMDYLDTIPTSSTGPTSLVLKTDNNGFYIHDAAGSDSGFSRKLTIQNLAGGESMRVVAEITWSVNNRSYSYDLETLLYDWH